VPFLGYLPVNYGFAPSIPDDRRVLVVVLATEDCRRYEEYVHAIIDDGPKTHCYAYIPYTTIKDELRPVLSFVTDIEGGNPSLKNNWVNNHQTDYFIDGELDQTYSIQEAYVIPTIPVPVFGCIDLVVISGCQLGVLLNSKAQFLDPSWERPWFVLPFVSQERSRTGMLSDYKENVRSTLGLPVAKEEFRSHPVALELLDKVVNEYTKEELLFSLLNDWRETDPTWLYGYQSQSNSFECKTSYYDSDEIETAKFYYDVDSQTLRTEKTHMVPGGETTSSNKGEFRIVYLEEDKQLYWYPKFSDEGIIHGRVYQHSIIYGARDASDLKEFLNKEFDPRFIRETLECRLWDVDNTLLVSPV